MAERISSEFTSMVSDYIQICDELAEFNKKTKGIKSQKKQLEDDIKAYMIDNELFELDLKSAGSLSVTTKKVNKKVSKQEIQDVLLETIPLEEDRDTFILKVFPNEPEEVTKLQRKKGRN